MTLSRSKLASRIVDKLGTLPREAAASLERTYAKSYALAHCSHTGLCTVTATGRVWLERLEKTVDAEAERLASAKVAGGFVVRVTLEGQTWYVHTNGGRHNNRATAARYERYAAEGITEILTQSFRGCTVEILED